MAARILVADDSVTIQKVVELTFSKEGFVLVQARSGEETIHKAKEQRPDLILLDLVMPDKNGYEVCAALRAEAVLRSVPIIMLAGTFEGYDKDKGARVGANDFVTKPFESQVLIGKVKQLLFAKTLDLGVAAPAAPPKEVPRPAAPATPPPPPRVVPPGVPPRPSPAPVVTPPPAAATTSKLPPPAAAVPPRARTQVPPAAQPPRPTPPPSAPLLTPPPTAKAAAAPVRPAPTRPAPPPAPPPPPAAPKAPRTLDLSPPTEEISQERVRRVVEPPPPPPPPSFAPGLGELSLESLSAPPISETAGGLKELELEPVLPAPAPVSTGLPSLELPPLAPEPVEKQEVAPAAGIDMTSLPETLSLEDLLASAGAAPPLNVEREPAPVQEAEGESVFDLTSEMGGPSLPLVEVGAGEPPTLSIEDLLGTAEFAPAPAPSVEIAEEEAIAAPAEGEPGESVFDLTSEMGGPSLPLVEVGAGEPPTLSIEDLLAQAAPPMPEAGAALPELELEQFLGAPAEAAQAGRETAAAPPLLDLESLVEVPLTEEERVGLETALGGAKPAAPPPLPVMEVEPLVAEAMPVAAPPPAVPEAPVVPLLAEELPTFMAPPTAPAMAEAPPIRATPPVTPSMEAAVSIAAAMPPGPPEIARIREAVTERVARDLTREISDKLLERIERIVWEVVPELAEILITKEIERIRAAAEGKQSS